MKSISISNNKKIQLVYILLKKIELENAKTSNTTSSEFSLY